MFVPCEFVSFICISLKTFYCCFFLLLDDLSNVFFFQMEHCSQHFVDCEDVLVNEDRPMAASLVQHLFILKSGTEGTVYFPQCHMSQIAPHFFLDHLVLSFVAAAFASDSPGWGLKYQLRSSLDQVSESGNPVSTGWCCPLAISPFLSLLGLHRCASGCQSSTSVVLQ